MKKKVKHSMDCKFFEVVTRLTGPSKISLITCEQCQWKYLYIYIYIYIYHIEGAVFTTIWCSMYKVQSVDSSYIYIYIYIYIYMYI